jgi:hypothetical protein
MTPAKKRGANRLPAPNHRRYNFDDVMDGVTFVEEVDSIDKDDFNIASEDEEIVPFAP